MCEAYIAKKAGFFLVSCLLCPLPIKIISQSLIPQCPSNIKWVWNETWMTEWPLQNFLWQMRQLLKRVRNLVIQLRAYCFLHFFTSSWIGYILWVTIEMKTFPYFLCIVTLFVSISVLFFLKSANFAAFSLTTSRFPICFFFHWNFCPN